MAILKHAQKLKNSHLLFLLNTPYAQSDLHYTIMLSEFSPEPE